MRRIYSRAPSFFITRGDSICPCALRIITQTTTTAVCGGTPRMQTPKNMNVQAEQSVAGTTGSTPAPSTTASAAAAQAPQQINSIICSVSVSHPSFYHTPKHTLWLFVCAITPPFYHTPVLSHPQTHAVGVRTRYHTPIFITPPGDGCELHFTTGGTQYNTPPTV